jgi:aminoglycoside phosphotransferase (APT) family kinase protein
VEAELDVMELVRGDVLVPRVHHVEFDNADTGKHLVVLEYMEGEPLHRVEDAWTRSEVTALAHDLGRRLAAIHRHEFSGSGLLGPGLALATPFGCFGDTMLTHMLSCLDRAESRGRIENAEAFRLRKFIESNAGIVAPIRHDRRLTHSDFNQKNILVSKVDGAPRVSAILDWEFAFSGSPVMDLGNFFRFERELPEGYLPALVDGYQAAGGRLPDDWRRIARFLDLINLIMFLANEEDRPKTFDTALSVIRGTIADWYGTTT